jgi:hypothetical protein
VTDEQRRHVRRRLEAAFLEIGDARRDELSPDVERVLNVAESIAMVAATLVQVLDEPVTDAEAEPQHFRDVIGEGL